MSDINEYPVQPPPVDDKFAVVRLGVQRQMFDNGFFSMWTQRTTKAGDRLIVDVVQEFHEGAGYEPSKRYRFALMCVDIPTPEREISHRDYEDALASLASGLKGHGSIYYGEDELAKMALPALLEKFALRRLK